MDNVPNLSASVFTVMLAAAAAGVLITLHGGIADLSLRHREHEHPEMESAGLAAATAISAGSIAERRTRTTWNRGGSDE